MGPEGLSHLEGSQTTGYLTEEFTATWVWAFILCSLAIAMATFHRYEKRFDKDGLPIWKNLSENPEALEPFPKDCYPLATGAAVLSWVWMTSVKNKLAACGMMNLMSRQHEYGKPKPVEQIVKNENETDAEFKRRQLEFKFYNQQYQIELDAWQRNQNNLYLLVSVAVKDHKEAKSHLNSQVLTDTEACGALAVEALYFWIYESHQGASMKAILTSLTKVFKRRWSQHAPANDDADFRRVLTNFAEHYAQWRQHLVAARENPITGEKYTFEQRDFLSDSDVVEYIGRLFPVDDQAWKMVKMSFTEKNGITNYSTAMGVIQENLAGLTSNDVIDRMFDDDATGAGILGAPAVTGAKSSSVGPQFKCNLCGKDGHKPSWPGCEKHEIWKKKIETRKEKSKKKKAESKKVKSATKKGEGKSKVAPVQNNDSGTGSGNGGQGSAGQGEYTETRQCYNCQQFGHIAKDCPNPRRPRNQQPSHFAGVHYPTGGYVHGGYVAPTGAPPQAPVAGQMFPHQHYMPAPQGTPMVQSMPMMANVPNVPNVPPPYNNVKGAVMGNHNTNVTQPAAPMQYRALPAMAHVPTHIAPRVTWSQPGGKQDFRQ